MIKYAFVILIIFVFFAFTNTTEHLENLKEQRYLTFLSNLNENFKSKAPKTGPFRGSCDDKINNAIQLKALHEEYSRLPKTNSHQDSCLAAANHLCEFTHPYMYLSETQMPPKWLMKSLKNLPLPTHVNLSCFASNYNCCKQSNH
jgi:hypothetical protein